MGWISEYRHQSCSCSASYAITYWKGEQYTHMCMKHDKAHVCL